MRSPVRSGRRASASAAAAAAILFGVLILMSLVAERPSPPSIAAAAIGGRRALWRGGAGEWRRTLEDFGADDPSLQDSKRRVPNGPDPIHNRGAGESGRSPGRA